MPTQRSRTRFADYRRTLRAKRRGGHGAPDAARGNRPENPRSFWQLFVAFWGLLAGYQGSVIFSLATLTVATLLRSFRRWPRSS